MTEWRHFIQAGGRTVAQHTRKSSGSPETRYLHRDHLGSVESISDESGVRVAQLSFDAFGRRREGETWTLLAWNDWTEIGAQTAVTPRGYTGHEMLDEVALVHMNGRVYDPFLARMISADPTIPGPMNGQAFNRYAYVLNNPLNLVDPSGFTPVMGPSGELHVDGGGRLFHLGLAEAAGAAVCDDDGCPTAGAATGSHQGSGGGSFLINFLSSGSNRPGYSAAGISVIVGYNSDGTPITATLSGQFVGQAFVVDPGTICFTCGASLGFIGLSSPSPASTASKYGVIGLTAHRVGNGPLHLAIYFTGEDGATHWISAGPSEDGSMYLHSGQDGERPSDRPGENFFVGFVTPPKGVTAAEYFSSLSVADRSYCDCLMYPIFAGLAGGYNSNSYLFGLIAATGGRPSVDPSDFVGGTTPVPAHFFGTRP